MAKSIEIYRRKRLRDEPHKGHNRWHPDIAPGTTARDLEKHAKSPQLPGVRIPNEAFIGTAGLAPSHEQLGRWTAREAELLARGGRVFPPHAKGAVPAEGAVAKEGLRTIPPRENCGNADVRQLTRGSRLFVPVAVDGALYSVGDGHYAQGDSECCGTAIEIKATAVVRFKVYKNEAKKRLSGRAFRIPVSSRIRSTRCHAIAERHRLGAVARGHL